MAYSSKQKIAIWTLFDKISGTYDWVNRLMSFGQDQRWRCRMIHYLPHAKGLKGLDLATGTADVALLMLKKRLDITHIIGMDMSEKMLNQAASKIKRLKQEKRLTLQRGDACNIPMDSESVDFVTISFGIRNVEYLNVALTEINRVIKPGGRLIVLESSLPKNPVIRWFHKVYMRWIMPVLGGVIARDIAAY